VLRQRSPPPAGMTRHPSRLLGHDATEIRSPWNVWQYLGLGDFGTVQQRTLIPYPDQAELHHGRGVFVVAVYDFSGHLLGGFSDLEEGGDNIRPVLTMRWQVRVRECCHTW
jgi:hypothetical protein